MNAPRGRTIFIWLVAAAATFLLVRLACALADELPRLVEGLR